MQVDFLTTHGRHLEGDLITKDVLEADAELDEALRQVGYF